MKGTASSWKNGEVRAANVRRKWAQLHRHLVHRARPKTKKSKAALRTATPMRSSTKQLQLISSWLPKKRSKKQQKCNCFVYFYFFIFGGAQWGVRYRQQMRREHGHNYQNDWVHSGKKRANIFSCLALDSNGTRQKKKKTNDENSNHVLCLKWSPDYCICVNVRLPLVSNSLLPWKFPLGYSDLWHFSSCMEILLSQFKHEPDQGRLVHTCSQNPSIFPVRSPGNPESFVPVRRALAIFTTAFNFFGCAAACL